MRDPVGDVSAATDFLVGLGCRRIVYVGTSKGAEASLLAATQDPRIDAVVAISPTSVVWGNIGPGRDGIRWPERSSWTLRGLPYPFVPTDPNWSKEYVDGLVSYRGLFQHCLKIFKDEASKATIPVERAMAEIVLVAGGDDALWPSLDFAEAIVRRRKDAGKTTRLVSAPDAGHRILLPGENTPRSKSHAHGGNDPADASLGREAWGYIRDLL